MGLGPLICSWAEWAECRIRPVPRFTGIGIETEPIISVPDNQESNRNRNSQFRFGSAPVLGFFGSVLGSRLFLPRASDDRSAGTVQFLNRSEVMLGLISNVAHRSYPSACDSGEATALPAIL